MKKIVGILAAAAMVASVFAADISAKVRLEGSLFKFEDKAISALEVEHATDQAWNPIFAASTNGDKAGATVEVYGGAWDATSMGTWNHGYGIGIKTFKIWFSPIDGLKFNLGNIATNLNQEQIDWSNTDSGCDSEGYGLSYNSGAIGFDLNLLPGFGNNWMSKADGGDVEIAEAYFKFQYNGGDIGTINAMFDAKSTFKDLKFGAGYCNTFGGIMIFENVIGYLNDGFNKVRSETFAKGSADALSWAIWLPVDLNLAGDFSVGVGTIAKITYALDACNVYLYVKEGNFLADSFAIEVKPGLTGNCGGMDWEVAADMNIGGDFSINIPVNFTVNF